MASVTFLQPDIEQIRHQIHGVLDSYSHEWDLLSELAQNAVDAIRAANVIKGHISLTIDASKRIIRMSDNGIGIKPSEMEKLLRPFGTNKSNKANQIGEKGVGLKFVIFSSKLFKIKTNSEDGGCIATIEDAYSWLQSDRNDQLYLDISENTSGEGGTEIEIRLSTDDHPVFKYSFKELLFILKTKTALGDCGYIWDSPLNADVTFQHVDKGGKETSLEFECRYLLPTDLCGKSESILLDDFQAWLREADRSDAEKRRKLMNKIITAYGKEFQGGRNIRYWSCFVPRREYWKKLSQNFGIEYSDDDEALTIEELFGIGFSGGFVTSTKGMPTGISIELKPRGSAGYVSNFFILIDDPALRFDIGRKAVQNRQQGMLREIAYKIFRQYINQARKYMGGAIDPIDQDWERDEIFSEIESLPNLSAGASRFLKRPNSQEATVAGLFFEQLGRGEFMGISPLISGYKGRYDLYAKWNTRRVVIEFKFDLSGLFRDFSDERKMFDEINAVVVWEVTENDITLASRRAMSITEIQSTMLVKRTTFPGATKILHLGDVNPISIIELKPLLLG